MDVKAIKKKHLAELRKLKPKLRAMRKARRDAERRQKADPKLKELNLAMRGLRTSYDAASHAHDKKESEIRGKFINDTHVYYRTGEYGGTSIRDEVLNSLRPWGGASYLTDSQVEEVANALIDLERENDPDVKKLKTRRDRAYNKLDSAREKARDREEEFEAPWDGEVYQRVNFLTSELKELREHPERVTRRIVSRQKKDEARAKVFAHIPDIWKLLRYNREKADAEKKIKVLEPKVMNPPPTKAGLPGVIREITTKSESRDLKGVGIPKGTRLLVVEELPKAPFGDHHRLLKVRVDNGTGDIELMPETVVRDTEVE